MDKFVFRLHNHCVLYMSQEALSVVSEDQSIFESPFSSPQAMHMKGEITSPAVFRQGSEDSVEPTEPDWTGSAAQNPAKRAEHINGTRWGTKH